MLDLNIVRQEVDMKAMLVILYLLAIIGLSVLAVLIVDVFFDKNTAHKNIAIYIVSFLLGLGAFQLWWRKQKFK